MDVGQFLKNNIKYKNFIDDVKDFFDENVAIYNIITKYNIATEILTSVDSASITYFMKPSSDTDIDVVMDKLSNITISIYGHCYHLIIDKDIKNRTLSVKLTERASRVI